jgi:hypothetical protein
MTFASKRKAELVNKNGLCRSDFTYRLKGDIMRHLTNFARTLIPGALILSASALAADTQLLNLVMPDAQIMAGANVTTAKISPFGQYLLTQIGTNDEGLQDFITKTGFDPRQDVTEILAASTGNPAAPSGLILAKGSFNVDKLVAALPADSKQQVQNYAGATLISGPEPKTPHAVAFIGSSIAVAGDLASVKAALDRASGVNSISPALATRVQALSTTQDAWSVSLASMASLLPGAAVSGSKDSSVTQTLGLVKNIQASSGGVKFGANIELTGQAVADTPQNATALADVVRMLAGLVSLSAGQNPEIGAAAQLLQSMKVTTDGAAVNISASVPEAQVEALIKLASGPKLAPAARTGTRL